MADAQSVWNQTWLPGKRGRREGQGRVPWVEGKPCFQVIVFLEGLQESSMQEANG